jgi:hypothetical protein
LIVKVIDRLTEEQIVQLAEFRNRWIAIGLSTEPADRERAEHAIRRMYRVASLRPPTVIEWCGSPAALDRVKPSACLVIESGGPVVENVWATLGEGPWSRVKARLGPGPLLCAQTASDRVALAVWARVGRVIGLSFRSYPFGMEIHGQHDAGALMFYDFVGQICGLGDEVDELSGVLELAQSAGWAQPCEKICWVSERPSALQRDDLGRLHSLTGPAIVYPDGWSIHAVHGVRVPREVVEDANWITVQRIEAEPNSEIRRVMVLKYGAARYLQESGAKLVNESKRGKLWRKDRKGDNPLVMVEVQNSTPEPDGSRKTYFQRVPPHIKTAAAAVAWRFGFETVRDYRPAIET